MTIEIQTIEGGKNLSIMVTVPFNALSGIQTQDLTVCLYLNLKHGELDHMATTAGLMLQLIRLFLYNIYNYINKTDGSTTKFSFSLQKN